MRRRGRGGAGCSPAGTDPISTAVAASFAAWEKGLEALLAHSQAVRVAGGLAVAHTGKVLDGTDQAGGAAISSLASTPASSPDVALPGGAVPAPPALPVAPAVPSVPEPVSAQTWSAQIHAGAGPAPLAAYAARMRETSANLTAVAEQLRSQARAIDSHWDDGIQRAGANVTRLADWFDDTADYAREVAAAADHSADHVRDAVSGTPRPETFTHLQARINEGLQRFARSGGLDVVPLQVATTDMAEAQRNALDAQVAYAAAANTTTVEVPRPPKPAPPIVGGPSTKGGNTPEPSSASDDKTATDDTDRAKGKSADDEGGESGAEADTTAPALVTRHRTPQPIQMSGPPPQTRHRSAPRAPRGPLWTPQRCQRRRPPPATPRASFSAGWPRPPAACLPVSVAVGARRCRRSPRWQGCRAASAAGEFRAPRRWPPRRIWAWIAVGPVRRWTAAAAPGTPRPAAAGTWVPRCRAGALRRFPPRPRPSPRSARPPRPRAPRPPVGP